MTDAKPYTKESQLARGPRRYRRKVASPKQWQAIIAAKEAPCRICEHPASNGRVHSLIQFHHIVPRAQGGDDVADNIVPLCEKCHPFITSRDVQYARLLLSRLTDAEYAYAVGKAGEAWAERIYGIL